MTNRETILWSCVGLCFVVTTFAIRDLLRTDSLAVAGIVGGVAGFVSLLFILLFKTQKLIYPVIVGVLYCGTLIILVRTYSMDKKVTVRLVTKGSMDRGTASPASLPIVGEWVSDPSEGKIKMIFKENGALDIIVGKKKPSLMRYRYDGKELQLLTITNQVMATYKVGQFDSTKMELIHGVNKSTFFRR